jgi:long-chain acyl-CoA synthetase
MPDGREAERGALGARDRRRSSGGHFGPDRNDAEGTAAAMYAAEQAKKDPDKPAIIMATSGQTVTFGEYEAGANRVAHLLRDTGLVRGDHMAIFMENDPRMLITEGGAERTGLYYTCINSYLSVDEVA